jgi:hypothetical protein
MAVIELINTSLDGHKQSIALMFKRTFGTRVKPATCAADVRSEFTRMIPPVRTGIDAARGIR